MQPSCLNKLHEPRMLVKGEKRGLTGTCVLCVLCGSSPETYPTNTNTFVFSNLKRMDEGRESLRCSEVLILLLPAQGEPAAPGHHMARCTKLSGEVA